MLDPDSERTVGTLPDFDVLITADETWPAFERAVLHARSEIHASFRIFDLRTKLRSLDARAIGDDWFDLLAHVVGRGVKLRLVVSDFDPVVGTSLHELSWQTVRQGVALAEITEAPAGQITVRAALHSARAGALPWIALLPVALKLKSSRLRRLDEARLSRQAVRLNEGEAPQFRTATHHQKLAVIDGETLFIGGLDLNERRFDTTDHARPADQTWSDVQVLIRGGPEPLEAKEHLETFLAVTEGVKRPPKLRHIKRTLSAPRRLQFPFLSPRTVLREIEEAHLAAFRKARHLIHIETQFMRSGVIADALAEAASRNGDLRLVMILPALPEDAAFQTSHSLDVRYGMALQRDALHVIREGFGDRATIASPVRPVMAAREGLPVLSGSPIVYVHNKVLIRDDDYALIGSGNLNGRSLRWDTEAAVEITAPDRMGIVRRKILDHWWFDPLPPEMCDPETLQPLWAEKVARNGVRLPETRTGFLVPHDPDTLSATAQPLPGVTEDIV
ncbi:phospholipase D family protein [Marivita sp. GX14005]|uniref:phospholipase D family protein n=1 Tax=Marivita sp. GX14005 TaxID=2942276 RepID=UPI0020184DF5|nr:phospholipase D family protein [Marivita sp. GX14005]MCL3880732.1 phospholipase D family protein [Marivita sp. GX14005]